MDVEVNNLTINNLILTNFNKNILTVFIIITLIAIIQQIIFQCYSLCKFIYLCKKRRNNLYEPNSLDWRNNLNR